MSGTGGALWVLGYHHLVVLLHHHHFSEFIPEAISCSSVVLLVAHKLCEVQSHPGLVTDTVPGLVTDTVLFQGAIDFAGGT